MKNLIIPLLVATALLSGCHTTTVRHEAHLPPPAPGVVHRHVHDSKVIVHRHVGGQQTSHRHSQHSHYGHSRVVVVRGGHYPEPRGRGHGGDNNGNWRRVIQPRHDHRHKAKNSLHIWNVVRDAPHNRGDRDRSRHDYGSNDHGHDNGGHGHDGRGNNGSNGNNGNNGNNGKGNNGKANKTKARKVASKNSDKREKQKERMGKRKER